MNNIMEGKKSRAILNMDHQIIFFEKDLKSWDRVGDEIEIGRNGTYTNEMLDYCQTLFPDFLFAQLCYVFYNLYLHLKYFINYY